MRTDVTVVRLDDTRWTVTGTADQITTVLSEARRAGLALTADPLTETRTPGVFITTTRLVPPARPYVAPPPFWTRRRVVWTATTATGVLSLLVALGAVAWRAMAAAGSAGVIVAIAALTLTVRLMVRHRCTTTVKIEHRH